MLNTNLSICNISQYYKSINVACVLGKKTKNIVTISGRIELKEKFINGDVIFKISDLENNNLNPNATYIGYLISIDLNSILYQIYCDKITGGFPRFSTFEEVPPGYYFIHLSYEIN